MKKIYKLIIISGILIIIAAAIIYGVIKQANSVPQYYKSENKVVYNYFKFTKDKTDGFWYLEIMIKNQPYNIPFYYNPYDLLDIPAEPQTLQVISTFMKNNPKGRIYISVDPEDNSKIIVAGVEIVRLLGDRYNIFNFDVYSAISKPYNNTQYPIITCRNATSQQLVIMMNNVGFDSINNDGYCVMINFANANESVRVADAFSLRLLGIIR